jgi:S1-C subfamily serine protease
MARAVMSQLAKYGEVRRGRIGLTTQEITPELAKALGLTPNQGAVVVEVAPDSPAAKVGLKRGDVVVAVNRRKVNSTRELIAALKAPGRVVLSVVRGDYVFAIVLRR